MRNVFKEAHKMAREIKREYPEVDYKTQFGICLSYLLREGEDKMIEYKTNKGTSVKVKIEGKKVIDLIVNGVKVVKNNNEEYSCYLTRGFIVINSGSLYKKLGSKSVIRIQMNEELSTLYNSATNKIEKDLENKLKDWNNRKSKTDEYYKYSFKKHMTNKNNL